MRALRRLINSSDKSEEDQRDEGYGHGGSKAATEELLATIAVVNNTRGNARHAGYGSSVPSIDPHDPHAPEKQYDSFTEGSESGA